MSGTKVEFQVGKELQETIRRLELAAPGAAGRALDSELVDIVSEAKAEWPQKTGASARALRLRAALEHAVGGDVVVRVVEDLIPYSGAVHFKGEENTTCAEELVFDPIEEALDPILEAFAEELERSA